MGVAKAGLESCARYRARDLGPQRARVNLVAAGPLKTMAAKSIPGFDKSRTSGRSGRRSAGTSPNRRLRRGPASRCVGLVPATTGDRARRRGRARGRRLPPGPAGTHGSAVRLARRPVDPDTRFHGRFCGQGPTPAKAGREPGGLRASDADRDEVASRLRDQSRPGGFRSDVPVPDGRGVPGRAARRAAPAARGSAEPAAAAPRALPAAAAGRGMFPRRLVAGVCGWPATAWPEPREGVETAIPPPRRPA